MRLFLNRLIGWLHSGKPRIACDIDVWDAGVKELARRTLNGRRESGAFLLGRDDGSEKKILEFVFYDDIDPHALNSGIVHFSGNKFPKLWEHCRKRGYGVVADVHVHPGGYWQSVSDRAEPAMPRAGHIALIIPDYARRATRPGGIGMYEYLGNRAWLDHTKEGDAFFKLERRQ